MVLGYVAIGGRRYLPGGAVSVPLPGGRPVGSVRGGRASVGTSRRLHRIFGGTDGRHAVQGSARHGAGGVAGADRRRPSSAAGWLELLVQGGDPVDADLDQVAGDLVLGAAPHADPPNPPP